MHVFSWLQMEPDFRRHSAGLFRILPRRSSTTSTLHMQHMQNLLVMQQQPLSPRSGSSGGSSEAHSPMSGAAGGEGIGGGGGFGGSPRGSGGAGGEHRSPRRNSTATDLLVRHFTATKQQLQQEQQQAMMLQHRSSSPELAVIPSGGSESVLLTGGAGAHPLAGLMVPRQHSHSPIRRNVTSSALQGVGSPTSRLRYGAQADAGLQQTGLNPQLLRSESNSFLGSELAEKLNQGGRSSPGPSGSVQPSAGSGHAGGFAGSMAGLNIRRIVSSSSSSLLHQRSSVVTRLESTVETMDDVLEESAAEGRQS